MKLLFAPYVHELVGPLLYKIQNYKSTVILYFYKNIKNQKRKNKMRMRVRNTLNFAAIIYFIAY